MTTTIEHFIFSLKQHVRILVIISSEIGQAELFSDENIILSI